MPTLQNFEENALHIFFKKYTQIVRIKLYCQQNSAGVCTVVNFRITKFAHILLCEIKKYFFFLFARVVLFFLYKFCVMLWCIHAQLSFWFEKKIFRPREIVPLFSLSFPLFPAEKFFVWWKKTQIWRQKGRDLSLWLHMIINHCTCYYWNTEDELNKANNSPGYFFTTSKKNYTTSPAPHEKGKKENQRVSHQFSFCSLNNFVRKIMVVDKSTFVLLAEHTSPHFFHDIFFFKERGRRMLCT